MALRFAPRQPASPAPAPGDGTGLSGNERRHRSKGPKPCLEVLLWSPTTARMVSDPSDGRWVRGRSVAGRGLPLLLGAAGDAVDVGGHVLGVLAVDDAGRHLALA